MWAFLAHAALVSLHVLCYDVWFYVVHRAMHVPAVYNRIHYQHHAHRHPTWQHTFTAHAIENAGSGLGVFAPLAWFPYSASALATAWVFCFVRGVARHDKRLPWSAHHLKHHITPTCNFSAAYVDYMFGTIN